MVPQLNIPARRKHNSALATVSGMVCLLRMGMLSHNEIHLLISKKIAKFKSLSYDSFKTIKKIKF